MTQGAPGGWRRLDPRMLVVSPVHEAVRFLPALLILFVTGRSSERGYLWEVVALVAIVVLGMSRWFTTRYRVDRGQIELRRGLLRREAIATPAERVRTVDVTAPLLHRLMGLAKVEVGTGGGQGVERLVLDALSAREAAGLRAELLHRRDLAAGRVTEPTPTGGEAGRAEPAYPSDAAGGGPASVGPPDDAEQETVLLRFEPAWIRYAPLTTSGLVSAAAILGFFAQFADEVLAGRQEQIGGAISQAQSLGLLVGGLVLLVAGLLFVSVLAVTGYVLTYWGFRLTRHRGGTLHVTRGLLTSRATSFEEARMRGVEVGEPLGLRLAGAARLHAVTTGLGRGESARGSAWLSPPAPKPAVDAVARQVVGDDAALTGILRTHGPAARRRRYVRAVGAALVVAGIPAALGLWWRWPTAVVGLLLLLCGASPLLGRDRYAGLGHLLTARHIVARAGSFSRRRDVLSRPGVIGVVVRETFFQRRSGLATLTLTTAAGKQGYHVVDVSEPRAVELARELLPETVGQYLA